MLTSESPDAFPNFIFFITIVIFFMETSSTGPSTTPISVFWSHTFSLFIVFSICSFHTLFDPFHGTQVCHLSLKHRPLFISSPSFFKNFTSLNTLFHLSHKSYISCSASLLIALLTCLISLSFVIIFILF